MSAAMGFLLDEDDPEDDLLADLAPAADPPSAPAPEPLPPGRIEDARQPELLDWRQP
jgi:hypothetical protein